VGGFVPVVLYVGIRSLTDEHIQKLLVLDTILVFQRMLHVHEVHRGKAMRTCVDWLQIERVTLLSTSVVNVSGTKQLEGQENVISRCISACCKL
jgi:hypothetical protein